MRTAVVIPTLGAPSLAACLRALTHQTIPPERIVVVHSGGNPPPVAGPSVEIITSRKRLGFAAASNRGIGAVLSDVDAIALLNDDAEPHAAWLSTLLDALASCPQLGAVQGTVTDLDGSTVDGRGLEFDRWGLPIQVDRGKPASETGRQPEPRIGVSATAALFRSSTLRAARLPSGWVFDESVDCYHEDTDLTLRLCRLGIQSAWCPGASCRHLGSHSGSRLGWRHPWWIAANRWRALAANLSPSAMLFALPRLLRGEARVFATLKRNNPRVWLTETLLVLGLPAIIGRALIRHSPGPRLNALPVRTP